MVKFSSEYESLDFDTGAMPEAQKTKLEILRARKQAKEQLVYFHSNRKFDQFLNVRSAVLSYFYEMRPHVRQLVNQGKDYDDILKIDGRPKTFKKWKEVGHEDIQYYQELFERLEEALYDLNITNVQVKHNRKPYGYAFLKGLDHSLRTGMTGFKKLLENLKNMRKLLRKDTDLVGMIYGGNRTGKTNLSLICCDFVEYGEQAYKLPKSHMIFNDDDFNNALDNHDKYSAEHIDELSLLFHKKDGMNTEQKNRNKKLKTYSKKNFFILGCDNNFFNVDKETRNDKIDFVIHVPKRGRFEFYSKAKLSRFEQGAEGQPETPRPDFKGRFPKLDKPGEESKNLWDRYKEVEDKKLEVSDDDDGAVDPEEKANEIQEIAEKVKDNLDDYLKELEGRDPIISHRIVKARNGISDEDAKTVKDLVEAEINLSEIET